MKIELYILREGGKEMIKPKPIGCSSFLFDIFDCKASILNPHIHLGRAHITCAASHPNAVVIDLEGLVKGQYQQWRVVFQASEEIVDED